MYEYFILHIKKKSNLGCRCLKVKNLSWLWSKHSVKMKTKEMLHCMKMQGGGQEPKDVGGISNWKRQGDGLSPIREDTG